MPKHKTEDYKLSAVQYYLENDVSYVPHTNGAIEGYFNQMKNYLKLNKKVFEI